MAHERFTESRYIIELYQGVSQISPVFEIITVNGLRITGPILVKCAFLGF